MDIVSEFHLGDFVNRILPGSLVMLPSESTDESVRTFGGPVDAVPSSSSITAPTTVVGGTSQSIPSHCFNRQLFGTVTGAIGVLFNVTQPLFALLSRAQLAIRQ